MGSIWRTISVNRWSTYQAKAFIHEIWGRHFLLILLHTSMPLPMLFWRDSYLPTEDWGEGTDSCWGWNWWKVSLPSGSSRFPWVELCLQIFWFRPLWHEPEYTFRPLKEVISVNLKSIRVFFQREILSSYTSHLQVL